LPIGSLIHGVVCTVLLAATMAAQGRMGAMMGSTPDPATMIPQHVVRLTSLLTLTTAQQAQATTIFTAAATSAQPIHTSLTAAQQSMQAAVKSNNTATIKTYATTIGQLMGELVEVHSSAQGAFYAILTADQKTKMDQTGSAGGPGFGMMGGGMGAGMMGAGGPPWMRH